MIELYVYYKVEPAQRTAARAALERAAAGSALQVRLLRRPDTAPGTPETWMEVHSGPEAEAGERLLAAALAPWLSGPRHVERFVPLEHGGA